MRIRFFKTSLFAAFFCALFLAACSDYKSQQGTGADSTSRQSSNEEILRVVGMNLENYFNGDGRGRGYPTPRGAETADEFEQQRQRIGAAIKELDPHVIAVMELENDGFDVNSAAQDFIRLANNATSAQWAVARPTNNKIGADLISVGLFYRSDLLQPIGSAQTLSGPNFKRSRQPLAQALQRLSDGEKTLYVINHLKSKGSCPEFGVNTNSDGQGCWNQLRKDSAEEMTRWTRDLADNAGINSILILGDMNAYRDEDPIEAIRDAGFIELMDAQKGSNYSFVFHGRRGALDYAFVSDALHKTVDNAFIWHVNTDKPETMDLSQPWLGFSDHDPVVVDIRSRHSSTSD